MNKSTTCKSESDHEYTVDGTACIPQCKSINGDKTFPAMNVKIKRCGICGTPEIIFRVAYLETFRRLYAERKAPD